LSVAFVACVGDSPTTNDGGADAGSDVTVNDTGADAPPSCDGGNICGTACVDLQTSATNCGKCGNACKTGVTCVAGQCGDTVVEVASSNTNACAVRLDGKVVCWGTNDHSELGVDPQPSDPNCNGIKCVGPTVHASLADVAHVALGDEFGCAIKKTDGSVVCWGNNASGQLAALPATYSHSATPLPVALPAKAKSLSLGTSTACALTESGDVYCWGNNATGIAGKADSATASTTIAGQGLAANDMVTSPNKIGFPASDVTAIAISNGDLPHGCAIRNNDTVWCWGGNYVFELGEWDVTSSACHLCETTPINIAAVEVTNKQPNPGFGGAFAVAVANGTSCVVAGPNSTVYCWGNANVGFSQVQPSGTDFNNCGPAARPQIGLPNKAINEIQMGNFPVMARDNTGAVWAWGTNAYGDQGDGTHTTPRLTPTSISNLAGLSQLSELGGHVGVGLKKDGSVISWGINQYGQLGHAPATGSDIADCGGGYPCNPTPAVVTMP
jgi:alpha-tubulin suppressor-like RCC1 family protein